MSLRPVLVDLSPDESRPAIAWMAPRYERALRFIMRLERLWERLR